MSTTMLDNKTLESRLMLKESVIGGTTSISKCATKLQILSKDKTDATALEGFLRELLLLKLEVDKSRKTFDICERQSEEYDKLEADIGNRIAEANSNICFLEEELRQQKLLREHRAECELLADTVNKYPSRSILKRKIAALDESSASTEVMLQAADAEIAHRKEQFDTLQLAIAELRKQTITEEESAKLHFDDENIDEDEEDEENERGGGRMSTSQRNQLELTEEPKHSEGVDELEDEGDSENAVNEDGEDGAYKQECLKTDSNDDHDDGVQEILCDKELVHTEEATQLPHENDTNVEDMDTTE